MEGRSCDDAAVERGALAVEKEIIGRAGGDHWLYNMDEDVAMDLVRSIAASVLRAAGEIPHER